MAKMETAMLDSVLAMDAERRAEILKLIAGSDSAALDKLTKSVDKAEKNRNKSAEKIAAEKAAAERKEALEALDIKVQSYDGDFEVLETLFEDATELSAKLSVDGFVDGVPTFVLTGLPAPKKKRGGGGRGKADAPTDYVNAESGERIVGYFTTFAKDNLSAEELAELSDENGKLKKAGKALIKALEDLGKIRHEPAAEETAEDSQENEDSEEESESEAPSE